MIKCDSLAVLNTTRHEIIETNFQFVRYPSEILDFFYQSTRVLVSRVSPVFAESVLMRGPPINIFN